MLRKFMVMCYKINVLEHRLWFLYYEIMVKKIKNDPHQSRHVRGRQGFDENVKTCRRFLTAGCDAECNGIRKVVRVTFSLF